MRRWTRVGAALPVALWVLACASAPSVSDSVPTDTAAEASGDSEAQADGTPTKPFCPGPKKCACKTVEDCLAFEPAPCRKWECLGQVCTNVGDPSRVGQPCTWAGDCAWESTCQLGGCGYRPSLDCPPVFVDSSCGTTVCDGETGCPVPVLHDPSSVNCDDDPCTGPDYCSGLTFSCHPGPESECDDPSGLCTPGACHPFGGCVETELDQSECMTAW